MKNLFSAIIVLLLPFMASAQFTLSGKVTDQQTGQALPGATVTIVNPSQSTVTNTEGNYQFSNLPSRSYQVRVTYIGYRLLEKTITLNAGSILNFPLNKGNVLTDEVTVSATRAPKNSPTAYTNLSRKDIAKNNFGQDLPYLLNQTPSVITTSDAGAGVGYTSMRIRGSDNSRINVTINGIPYNDAESQGSFFVDIPDIASSVDNIQVQRGVGTSTNGAGAFGGSINIQTTTRRDSAYADISNSAGSFGTVKNTISAGTGLLGGKFTLDGRLSRIRSDGYIDRASSRLKSFYVSGAYYGKKSIVRANVFSGYERTYQAWNGVPDYIIGNDTIPNNRTYNELGLMPNGHYKDQVDDYLQNHYQLLYDQQLSDKLTFSGALHYTRGRGYYEEYRQGDSVKNYGLTPVIISGTAIQATDLARRRWLDNDFYGVTYALKYKPDNALNLTLGGAYNIYDGDHFGNIIYTRESAGIDPNYEYYRDNAKKHDFNIFGRAEYRLKDVLLFADMQYRRVNYSFLGYDRNLNNVQQEADLNFFNPKLGITYNLNENSNVYASFAVGNREPNRDDYTNSTPQSRPKHENLKDFEAGYRTTGRFFSGSINGFYMLYKNQLILTGQLNDVGSATRRNVDDSYRAGVELEGRVRILPQLTWGATATVSTNKIKNYRQFWSKDDETLVEQTLSKTTIAYSPSFIGSSEISFTPFKGAELAFVSKYVGSQFLDNTSNTNPAGFTIDPANASNTYAANRKLDKYFVNDIRLRYNFSIHSVKNISVGLLINNLFNEHYEANGATYAGIYHNGDVNKDFVYNYNYFFPQATRNFLASLTLSF